MSPRAPTLCAEVGCCEFVHGGSRCEKHRKAKRAADAQRRGPQPTTPRNAILNTSNRHWRMTRSRFLSAHPECACGRRATVAHHKRDLKDGGTNEWRNLEPKCERCHNRITASRQQRESGRFV